MNLKNTKSILFIITFTVVILTIAENIFIIRDAVFALFAVMSPVILGLCIAFILNIPTRAFENRVYKKVKKASLRRCLSIASAVLCVLLAVTLVFVFIIPQLADSAVPLAEKAAYGFNRLIESIEKLLVSFNISEERLPEIKIDVANIIQSVFGYVSAGSARFFTTATNVTATVLGGAVNFFLGLVLAIYVLAQKEQIAHFLKRLCDVLFPERINAVIYDIFTLSNEVFSAFVSGQLLDAAILGVLCFLSMCIFRFPYATVTSVLVAVTALIPVFGAFIGAAVGCLLILTESFRSAFLFVIMIVALQQIEGNIIYPKIVGKSISLPGILVLTAVIFGGNALGVSGALISVPLTSVLYSLLKKWLSYRESLRLHTKAEAANADKKDFE